MLNHTEFSMTKMQTNIRTATAVLSLMCGMAASAQLPSIDLTRGAFSYRGSYLSFTRYQGREKEPAHSLALNTITRRGQNILLFTITALENGVEVPSVITADPSQLQIKTANGQAVICFQTADIIRIQVKNMTLRLRPPIECMLMRVAQNIWRYHAEWTERFLITTHEGSFSHLPSKPDKVQDVYSNVTFDISANATGPADVAFEYYLSQTVPKASKPTIYAIINERSKEFTQWRNAMPAVPEQYRPTLEQAAWVNWSSLVQPRDEITREGMVMSKLWMNAIWSWDHCFNAMATAYSDPKLAFDQLMVVLDKQNSLGALPDDVYESRTGWGYLKPPIHGWALKCMMEKAGAVTPAMLKEIYPHLEAWTNFYFTYRDDNKNGLAETHHGNDSGADNATVFDDGMPVDDPALNAYLIIQMDVLSDIATKLGKKTAAKEWKQRADSLFKLLMTNLWDGDKFVFRRVFDGKPNHAPYSFLPVMPLMLADRLPQEVQRKIIAFMRETLITPYGIATEGIKSPKYPKATYLYWRGAVWPPTMYMLIDALDRCGEQKMAKDLAKAFCDMCTKEGFAENFNPISGKGLVDPAYTWTSSVFILLAHEYLNTK